MRGPWRPCAAEAGAVPPVLSQQGAGSAGEAASDGVSAKPLWGFYFIRGSFWPDGRRGGWMRRRPLAGAGHGSG
jgi:hypothetical protein